MSCDKRDIWPLLVKRAVLTEPQPRRYLSGFQAIQGKLMVKEPEKTTLAYEARLSGINGEAM